MSENSLLPIGEAASQMKSTDLNVLMHVKRGLIKGEEIDGEWFVEQTSLTEFMASHAGKADVCEKKHHCGAGGCGSSCS